MTRPLPALLPLLLLAARGVAADCPKDTLLDPTTGACARVEDRRSLFASPGEGPTPPNLRTQRGTANGTPGRGSALAPQSVIGVGVVYQAGHLRVTNDAVLYTKMVVRPEGVGNLPDWLYTTSTNRVDRSVEVVGMYHGPDIAALGVFDWSCSPGSPCEGGATHPEWIWTRPFTQLGCYYRPQADDGGHLLPVLYYANQSVLVADQWENRIYLWNYCDDAWSLVYSHFYDDPQRDCSAFDFECGWWGPILESFLPTPQPAIPELGFFASELHYDGAISQMYPEDTGFYNPLPTWTLLHRIPNRSWGVATVGPQAVEVSFVLSGSTVSEADATAPFSVRIRTSDDQPLRNDVTVRHATSDVTARAGLDYTAAADGILFPAGTPSGSVKTRQVQLIDDDLDEADETFRITLSNPTGAVLVEPTVHTVTIADDDPAPALSVGDCAVAEGNAPPPVSCRFTISLSNASGRTVRVQAATANGTAMAGTDYTARSLEAVFPPGSTSYPVDVDVLGDLLDEDDETFFLNLSAPVNATITDGTGLGTIRDDDAAPALSVGDCTVTEGTGTNVICNLTVALSAASGRTVSVSYASADITARAGFDYVATSGPVTFPAGITSRVVPVSVIGDLSDEPNETFSLNLSAPVNATIADGTGIGTIVDDDAPPTMRIADVRVSDRNFGTIAYFTVSLSAPSGFPVSVSYATADGSAVAGQDYVARQGLLSFPLDTGKQTVAVPIIQDARDEGTESFVVDLSGAANAQILDGQGQGFIVERATPATCGRRLDPLDDQTGLPVDLLISEISPTRHIELYNPTAQPLALDSSLQQLVSGNTAVPLSTLASSVVVPARGYARLPWPSFSDRDTGGEILLYRDRQIENPLKIVDFVCWGVSPHPSRKDQAESVGKWSGSCAPALSAQAIHRRAFTKGTTAGDYDTASPPSPMSCAAVYTVTQPDDDGDGICNDKCTLREAVAAANGSPGQDTIFLPAGLYTLGSLRFGSVGVQAEPLVLTGDTDVVGDGAVSTVVDGGGRPNDVRVLEVADGATVSIRGLTLQNGNSTGDGGALISAGQLTVTDSTLTMSTARDGGAVAITGGQATLRNVTLSHNTASGNGGALTASCVACTVTLINVTISGNRADGDGGAVYLGSGSEIGIHHSTISANQANADDNGVGAGGGVAATAGVQLVLRNTVLAGNTVMAGGVAAGSDCTNGCGCIGSLGYNLVGTDSACFFPASTGDEVGVSMPIDPRLGPLANNGGPAATHALLTGSPALDTSNPASPECERTDERSFQRPQDGNGDRLRRCDKGAFELCPLPFGDIPPGSPLAPFVTELFCRGVATGCGGDPPNYCPTSVVTRAQMAVFLVSAMGEQPSGALFNAYFTDVADNAFAGHINRLYELGISSGCGAGRFCPDDPVTRAQMAVFLVVALEERPSVAPYNQYFSDIADDGFAPYINRLYELGITGGCAPGRFCPSQLVTRGDMAVFLAASFFRY